MIRKATRGDHVDGLRSDLAASEQCRSKAAKLHDELHNLLEEMGQHGTSAGSHLEAISGERNFRPAARTVEDARKNMHAAAAAGHELMRPRAKAGESDAHFCARMRAWLAEGVAIASANYRGRG